MWGIRENRSKLWSFTYFSSYTLQNPNWKVFLFFKILKFNFLTQKSRMLSNDLRTVNDVLRKTFPGITSSGLRVEQQRMKCASTYCLLGGAGTHFYMIISNFTYWFPWFFLGTFYLLIVIACTTLKTLIKTTNSGDILRIANNLRCPDLSELLTLLFKDFPLKFA